MALSDCRVGDRGARAAHPVRRNGHSRKSGSRYSARRSGRPGRRQRLRQNHFTAGDHHAVAPVAGSIHLFGQEIVGIGDSAAFRLRRRFGMLFQQGALFSSLTVRENVAVPLREHTRLPARRIAEIADLKIALAGLPADAGVTSCRAS
jgi:hypothetical protein